MHHPDDPDWHKVERACTDGSVFDADLETLRKYARVTSRIPPSQNQAFHVKFTQYCATIRHRIELLESERTEKRMVFWAKAAAIAAGIAAVLALLQWLFPRHLSTPQPEAIELSSPATLKQTPDTKSLGQTEEKH